MVQAGKKRGYIVCALFFSLERRKTRWQSNPNRLRLKLYRERHTQVILFCRHKKERTVFLEMSTQRCAELVLHVHRWIAKSVRRSHVLIPVHVESFAMPIIGAGFSHSVDEPRIRAADFRVRTAADYLELAHSR